MSPSRDVDELASGLMDGLLDPDEAATARRDPAVAARLVEMRAAREALRQVPPPDARRRDEVIATALRAADGAGATGQPGGHGSTAEPLTGGGPAGRHDPGHHPDVVPLSARRRTWWADPRWLGAAAALVLVLAAGVGLAVRSTDDDETAGIPTTADARADDEAAESQTGGQAPESDAEAGAGRDTGTAEPGAAPPGDGSELSAEESSGSRVVDLGRADSPEDLARRVRLTLADGEDEVDTRRGGGEDGADAATTTSACADPLSSAVGAGPLVLQGRATLDGRPVDVWVHDDGTSVRLVAADASCTVVADQLVPG